MRISTLQRMIALNRKEIRAQELKIDLCKQSLAMLRQFNALSANYLHVLRDTGQDSALVSSESIARETKREAQLVSKLRRHKQKLAKLVETQKEMLRELRKQTDKMIDRRDRGWARLNALLEFNEEWDQRSVWGRWLSVSTETVTRFFK